MIRHWLRRRLLKVRFIKDGTVVRIELRICGFRVGRDTYCKVGRWLGRKPEDIEMRKL